MGDGNWWSFRKLLNGNWFAMGRSVVYWRCWWWRWSGINDSGIWTNIVVGFFIRLNTPFLQLLHILSVLNMRMVVFITRKLFIGWVRMRLRMMFVVWAYHWNWNWYWHMVVMMGNLQNQQLINVRSNCVLLALG